MTPELMKLYMRIIIFSLLAFLTASINSCSSQFKKEVTETYPDGSIKTEKFYTEINGKKELQKQIDYYPNKKRRLVGEYKHEQRNGKWIYYYENGKIWSEGNFVNELNDGLRTTYFENGQIRYQGSYKMGDRAGKWKFYNEAGDLVKEIDYGDGSGSNKSVADSLEITK